MNRTALYAAVAASALLAPAAAFANAFAVNTDGSNFTGTLYNGSTSCIYNLSSVSAQQPLGCYGPSSSDINRIEWPAGTLKSMHGAPGNAPGASGIQNYFLGEYSANPGVNASQVQIGGLQMTTGAHPGGTATLNYNLVIQITQPSGATQTHTYGLNVTTTSHSPKGTGGTNSIQTILSGVLSPMSVEAGDGTVYTLSNFTWSDINCTSGVNNANLTCAPTSVSYSSGVWSVNSSGSGQISDLILSADVSVPEPGTLAILGSGLGLLGLVRRRRARKS